jgi:hypothetical protein
MLLTANVKKRLEIPGHDGQWVEIRKIGWRKLREASEEQQRQALQYVRALGKEGMELVKSVTADQIDTHKRRPAASYDAAMLLRSAVNAWSLSEKPSPEELDGLPEEVADWLVDEIVALAKPPRDEGEAKNG